MYVGCSAETYVYACCITNRTCICGKIYFFGSRIQKNGTSSLHREMEGHPSKLNGGSKFVITPTFLKRT
jgi:hypothetical protein